jgi:precorrin-6B methylase 2
MMVAFRLVLSVTLLFAILVGCGINDVSAVESQGNSRVQSSKTKTVELSRYSFRKEHDRNGIGKFYMGREIARVMGFGGVDWLERPQRQTEENLTLLVKSLKLKQGMVVADIGAGSGVISVLMADQIGTEGKVMAIDVQRKMLDRLKAKVKRLEIENILPVKGTQKTTGLKEKSVDLVILVDVYHEFAFPYEMMLEISRILKPGGRVAFVEYRKEDPTVPIKLVHKMTQAQVKKEITQPEFGLKWKETIGVLPRQHIVVFERVSESE